MLFQNIVTVQSLINKYQQNLKMNNLFLRIFFKFEKLMLFCISVPHSYREHSPTYIEKPGES